VGLSIAQRVVTDLGGTIELSSRGKNMGTVATVTLPMDGTIGKSSGEEG
jgi:signal transduction histidine kinase